MSTDGDQGSGREDDRVLVAEYALGLLGAAEHEALARRLADEPALRAELRLWQLRLASLDREFVEAAPPEAVLARLEARLFGEGRAAEKGLAGWWNNLALWRGFAAAAVVVAGVAIGANLMRPQLDPQAFATQLVAALQAQEGSGVEFVALYDAATGSVRLVGLGGEVASDRDLELWYIEGDEPAVSMGVVPVNASTEIPLDTTARQKFGTGTVLALTLEQKGGSPTGVAQGPIVAVGTATPI